MDTLASGKARQYHLVLPEIHPSALAIIREILDAHLRLWEKTELGFLIALGVTELLTNVHKHTRGDCELLVRDMPDGVLVAVVVLHQSTSLIDTLERRFYDFGSTSTARMPSRAR